MRAKILLFFEICKSRSLFVAFLHRISRYLAVIYVTITANGSNKKMMWDYGIRKSLKSVKVSLQIFEQEKKAHEALFLVILEAVSVFEKACYKPKRVTGELPGRGCFSRCL